jgi:starvation-inducible DNA-binding protein
MSTNRIGLNSEKAKNLADKLNLLLSNYQMFYINTRGFHWNIMGHKFFELHLKFEEVYTDSLVKIDEIAERVLTLGYTPLHSFSAYSKNSTIGEAQDISEGDKAVQILLDGYGELLKIEREILHLSDEAKDEGTNSMVSDYIREQEKTVWMFSSYLK